MTLEDALIECATAPDMTAFRATSILRRADPAVRAYELTDRRLWVKIGADWATLADWAELASAS
jgi:hypothetical protein